MKTKSLFQCPVCAKSLTQGEKQYFCRSGHCYDIARQGYVNLLLPSHIGSGNPGDDKDMIQSRREFLNKGYYEKFSDQLSNIVINNLSSKSDSEKACILDAGCGEGYYTSRLVDKLLSAFGSDKIEVYGIDVSKPAVHSAAVRNKNIRFAVASTYHIPVLSNSLDFILCVFAPKDEKEFRRILKPSGLLIIAAPGPRHLYGLRASLYESPELIGLKGTAGEGFTPLEHINVNYNIHLKDNQDILNLLRMTPYSRHTNQEIVENLKKLNELETEVDFSIMIYEKK